MTHIGSSHGIRVVGLSDPPFPSIRRLRNGLLLLILDPPPLVRIQSAGRVDLFEGVNIGLEELCSAAALPAADVEHLVQAIPETFRWITWQEIRFMVAEAAATYPCGDTGLAGTIRRLAEGVTNAIDWHSRPK